MYLLSYGADTCLDRLNVLCRYVVEGKFFTQK
jgi:hypothetical protein